MTKETLNEIRKAFNDQIARAILSEPTMTYDDISEKYGVSKSHVVNVARSIPLHRPRGRKSGKPSTK